LAALLLVLVMAAAAHGRQGGVPTDADVEQARQNIALLERTAPPPGHEADHRKDIAALRLALRDKLQAQRNAIAAYLDTVRAALPPERVAQYEAKILDKERQIREAADALVASVASPPVPTTDATPAGGGDAVTADPATTAAVTAGAVGNGGVVGAGGAGGAGRARAATPRAGKLQVLGGVPGLLAEALSPAALQPLDAAGGSGAVASGAEAAGGAKELSPCAAINVSNAKQFSEYELAICDLVSNVRDRKTGGTAVTGVPLIPTDPDEAGLVTQGANPRAGISLNNNPLELQKIIAAKLIGREERGRFLVEAEEARTDKQVEGGPENSGSTSLVVKGGAPSVFGFAVSNGALTRTQSGTTFTFRGNPVGLLKLLQNKTFDESYLEDRRDPFTRFVKKTSFSVSFDTDRGDEPGVFAGDPQQISAWSVRHEFVNERDPRHRKHQEALRQFLAREGDNLTRAIFDTYASLIVDVGGAGGRPLKGNRFKDPVLQAWLEETNALVSAAPPGDVEAVVKTQLDKFPAPADLSSESRDAVDRFARNFSGYVRARRSLLDEIAKGKVVTFEYTNNREVNAPDLSNFRLIAETGVFGGKADLTGNASFTVYNARPAGGAGRVRDFQFAGQFDVPFRVTGVGSFVFSFAGKYERLMGDATALDGTVLPGTRGDIAVGQLKLEVPFLAGMRLPLSLTFANRTELVRETEVRGNFGFTFDMDKILARFKPF
jgi:hypothetical protein